MWCDRKRHKAAFPAASMGKGVMKNARARTLFTSRRCAQRAKTCARIESRQRERRIPGSWCSGTKCENNGTCDIRAPASTSYAQRLCNGATGWKRARKRKKRTDLNLGLRSIIFCQMWQNYQLILMKINVNIIILY